jgi:MFS family permease
MGAWVAGRLATDASRVICVLAGMAGTAVSIGLAGLAPTVGVFAVCLALLGTFNGGANAAIGALFVPRPAEADRGKVLAAVSGVQRVGSVLALGLGALVGGWLGGVSDFCRRCAALRSLIVVAGLARSLRGTDHLPRDGRRLQERRLDDPVVVEGLIRPSSWVALTIPRTCPR